MFVLEAVAALVFLADQVEHVGPGVARFLRFFADPGGGTQVLGGDGAGHVSLQFNACHQHAVVPASLDLGGGCERGDAARCASRFVARGGRAVQARVDGAQHAAELALAGEEFADKVADVAGFDVACVNVRIGERALHGFAHEFKQALAGA